MPTLHFSDEEKDLLLSLAQPIDQRLRSEFLAAVAEGIEAKRQAGEIGEGLVHRLARTIQREILGSAKPAEHLASAPRQRRLRENGRDGC